MPAWTPALHAHYRWIIVAAGGVLWERLGSPPAENGSDVRAQRTRQIVGGQAKLGLQLLDRLPRRHV